jgi:hypothetical protein
MMQLRDARLCADCDEVHDLDQCPHCASERFSFLTRWVPLPEGQARPRPQTSPRAEAFRQLIDPPAERPKTRIANVLTNGAFGLAAVGIVGWLWRSSGQARRQSAAPDDARKAG